MVQKQFESDLNNETIKMQGIRPNHKTLSINKKLEIKVGKLGSQDDTAIEKAKYTKRNSNTFSQKRESKAFIKRSTTQKQREAEQRKRNNQSRQNRSGEKVQHTTHSPAKRNPVNNVPDFLERKSRNSSLNF